MTAFITAIFLTLITPGPGVLSAAGVGAAFGFKPGLRYVTGLFLGTNLVALAVISGLATIIFALPGARYVLLILSTLYLLTLAFRIAFAGSRIAFITAQGKPGIRAGILLQVINPKAYVFNTMMFSGFAFMPQSLFLETLVKLLIINLIWVPIHLLWLGAGNMVQQLDLAPRTQFTINCLMAVSMMGVVALAILNAP